MAKDTGKKLIDMMYGQNPDQAAFGVYPQLKPKRTAQDPQAAKNVPVDLLRGAVSGVLGAPGDIESLIRLLPGLDENTILPTSEDIEKRLPFKSDTPVSRAATGLGQIGGGFYTGPGSPLRLAGALPGAVKRAGQDFAMAAAESGPKIFIGPKAKTWNQAKADAAIRMEKEGVDPGVIWQQTGTFRGADGILRQEIDDRAAKFLMPDERQERVDAIKQKIGEMQEQVKRTPQKDLFPKALTEAKKEVRDDIDILKGEVRGRTKNPRTQGLQAQFIFEHPELYKAYPELQNVNVVTEGSGGAGTRGALSIIPSRGQIPGKMEMDVYDRGLIDNPTSTTLHEMQHAVQTLEGMGPGGNPTFAFSDPRASEMLQQERLKMLKALPYEDFVRQGGYTDMEQAGKDYVKYTKGLEGGIDPAYDRMLQERVAMEYYKRLLGEAEARAVQDRQLMTPAQRMETPPAASYDVPQEDLIVKPPREFAEGGQVIISEDPDVMQMELAGGGLVKGLVKAVKGTQEVLPAAEREANLAKMLEQSKVKQRMYHSTKNDFNVFDTKREATMGEGSFFGHKPNMKFAEGEGGNIMPVYLSIKNPKVFESIFDYDGFNKKELIDQGYDGVILKDNGKLLNAVAFHPEQIKSATGNVGTYDLTNPEINKAGGGLVKGLVKAAQAAKEAPSIIIPGKIQNVREAVRSREGNYAAKRVERAADEVRNLEKMFTEEALKRVFTGDNAKAVVTMSPADFEKYAQALKGRTQADIGPEMAKLAKQGEIDKYTVPTDEYIQHLLRVQGGFDQVPYLNLFKDEVGIPSMPEVRGHEGRHRSRALSEAGEPSTLVEISPRGDLREGLPRRSQEEYIEALREELERSGRMVLPEADGSYRRPAIELPELYAEGGEVHMDEGGAAFGQYTAGKKYQAAKRRAENADVNLLPDPKTYAVVQGLLGTAPDEMGFSVLHPKYQEIKEVADPAFAVGTALQVMPAAKPGALALARKGERLAERVVPGIMERGGLPADILSGLAQGSQSYAKAAKEAAVPLDIPRVRPTKQAIMEAAERVGRQQLGEHVTNPLTGKTVNLAGRSKKEAQRLKEVQYEVEPIKDLPKMGPYEAKVGEVNIALPGDQSISDMLLKSVEGVPIGSTQEGGALFGRGRLQDPEAIRAFWASNLVPAQNFQNKVDEIARMFNTDQVTAYHLAMGQTANNFAQHLADANMRAIDYSKLNKNKMDIFDSHIAAGFSVKDKKTGKYVHTTFPDWPGIANPEAALQAMKENPELRKWFNNRMKTEELTKGTDMPYGKAIEWAATEPELRNMEINLTGLSAGRMKPGAKLIPESAHQTYSHDIPGTALGHAPELAPFSISFPDVTDFVSKNYRPQDFTGTIQKVFPHQIVDEAYLEDMNKYYEQLRKVRGFADGGEVHGLSSQDMLYLQSQPDIGKMSPQEQREYVTNIKPDELRQRMQGKYAGGGEITADDLILEERKL